MTRPRRPTAAQALVLEGFLSRLSFGLLTFALPLYARHLGLSLTAIGALVSVSTAVSMTLKPWTGRLADRWGLRRTLALALLARSLLCLGYLVALAPWQLFAVRGVHGLSDSVRDPAVHALIAENGGKRTMATTFAWYQTAKTTAGSIGKGLAGALLATAGGYSLVFGVAFALSLLPVVAVLLAIPAARTGVRHGWAATAPATSQVVPPVQSPDVVTPGRARGVLPFAGLGFLVAGTSSLLTGLFPIIATEYAGLSTAQAGLVYLLTPALALTGPLWGRLADRVSRSLVLGVRSVANVLSAVCYLLAPNLVGIWVGRSLDDLGKAAFRPAWGSLMAEVSGRTPARRAQTMGWLTAGEDAGDLAAPLVAALIWGAFGVPALLGLRIAMALATEVYSFLLERRARAIPTPVDRSEATPVKL